MIWFVWWLPLRYLPGLRKWWRPASGRRVSTSLPPRRTRVGGFILEQELARGGEGRIWLTHGPHREQCIVKVSRSRRVDHMRQDAIAHEAEFLKALQGHGVPELLGEGDDPRYGRFLVATFIDGVPLQEWMSSHSGLSGLALLARLARRIAYCHRLGIIHGDIRADNILVDAANQPWLIDFGQGRWRRSAPDAADDESMRTDWSGLLDMIAHLRHTDLTVEQTDNCRRLRSDPTSFVQDASALAEQLERVAKGQRLLGKQTMPRRSLPQRLMWAGIAMGVTGVAMLWWLLH